jgi:hypothetical protein
MSAIDTILLQICSIKYNAFEDVMIGLNYASGIKTFQNLFSVNRNVRSKEVMITSIHMNKTFNSADIKSWKYLKSIADCTESVHSKVTSPNMLFKPKYDAK